MERVTSSDNQTIKMLRRLLSSRRHRERQGLFALEGINAVSSLFAPAQNRITPEILIVSDTLAETDSVAEMRAAAGKLRQLVVPDELLRRVQDARTSQGIVAVARIPNDPRPDPLPAGNYLLADGISDPGNMGTLIRTAVAADFKGLLRMSDCVDIYNPKCVRSTAGTLPFLPNWDICGEDIRHLSSHGFQIITARVGAGDSVYDMRFGPRNILAVGNEAHGLSQNLCDMESCAVHIPINQLCESLNAAVAAGVIMLTMQHSAKS